MRDDQRPGVIEVPRQLFDRFGELGVRDQAMRHDALAEVVHNMEDRRERGTSDIRAGNVHYGADVPGALLEPRGLAHAAESPIWE